VQYFNFSAGLFYTQRWFDGRNSDWIAASIRRVFTALDYLELFSGAAARGPN
jgi:hypothetical protein